MKVSVSTFNKNYDIKSINQNPMWDLYCKVRQKKHALAAGLYCSLSNTHRMYIFFLNIFEFHEHAHLDVAY